MCMISLKDVERIFKSRKSTVHALKGISLEVKQGEIFGIIGRSGAGKSTLIRCINLLERPTKGSIHIDQCNLTSLNPNDLRETRRSIGMIFQHFNLLNSRTVFQNVALPLELTKMPKAEIHRRVMSLLALTGIEDKAHVYPQYLSGGQKQRVAIARALANEPKILLCDEATSSLDPKTTHSILRLLRDINEKLNLTIILITHEMEVIKSICTRVAVMHLGEIVEEGSVLDVFANPKSDVAKEFVKSATRLEMPLALRRRMRPNPDPSMHPVVRISFMGQTAGEPLIAHVIQKFGLMVNIIQAHLETIREEPIGIMVVEMMGQQGAQSEHQSVQQALNYLEEKGLHIEVLGYAPRTA